MSSQLFLVLPFLGLFGAFAVNRWWSAHARLTRALAGAQRSPINRARDGVIKITGRVKALQDTLHAPVTGRPCVACQIMVDEPRVVGKASYWHPLVRWGRGVPFVVDDGTGQALVDPGIHFQLALVKDSRGSTGGIFQEPIPTLNGFLHEQGFDPSTFFGFDRRLRYEEGVLEEGELVTVGGDAIWEVALDGESGGYRSLPRRLALRGTSTHPLLISDDPQARGRSG